MNLSIITDYHLNLVFTAIELIYKMIVITYVSKFSSYYSNFRFKFI